MTIKQRIYAAQWRAIAMGVRGEDMEVFLGPAEVKELESSVKPLMVKLSEKAREEIAKGGFIKDGESEFAGMTIRLLACDGVRVGNTYVAAE